MNNYDRIASVIRHMNDCHPEQPPLPDLAHRAGLSPSHFHRLFTAWAGVTPKDFLQCLTVEHARKLLQRGESVLDSALEAGLSGPGRLHDLCVTLEAASPGEIKSGGANRMMQAGFAASPFGTCLLAQSERGICHLSFVEDKDAEDNWTELKAQWPNATFRRDDRFARGITQQIFEPAARGGSGSGLRAFVRGTPFQVRVWRALLRIPPGHLVSYGHLAASVAERTAARAVGTAVGQNPLAYLIPCHRVIRATGIIGEYRWGATRKRAILAWESAQDRVCPPDDGVAGVSSEAEPAGVGPLRAR